MTKERFTFFYGGPFSQWHRCKFEVDGVRYSSAEQYMMAGKAMLFGDEETRQKIMSTDDPQQQKIYGREVKNFDGDKWGALARDIVYKGNHAKFTQNEALKSALLETKDTTLVEASKTDQVWGIGLSSDDARAKSRLLWRGTNWLGEALTQLREDLIAGIERTEFKWADTFVSVLPVKVISDHNLWIWDHDKIRRQTADLIYWDQTLDWVDVHVMKEPEGGFEVEIIANSPNGGKNASGSHADLMQAFHRALDSLQGSKN